MPKVIIPQKNLTLDVKVGSNLMQVLLQAGLPVASSCDGDGICSMCRMQVQGEVNPPEPYEVDSLKRNKCEDGDRLSCQINITHDIHVRTKYW